MLSQDSEDEMWSRFMFELLIWLQEVTLARWTQPSGPLCLWQCLLLLMKLISLNLFVGIAISRKGEYNCALDKIFWWLIALFYLEKFFSIFSTCRSNYISLASAVLSGTNKQSLEASMRKMTSSKLNLSLYRFTMMRTRSANQTDLKIKGENVCCFYKEILLFGMSQQNQDFIICEFVFIDYKICQRHNRPEGWVLLPKWLPISSTTSSKQATSKLRLNNSDIE